MLCLPHDLHHPFTLQAAAGKHVLVEKPMALNEVEAQEMVAAADKAGVQLSIGQSSRCIPSYVQARTLLAQQAIGPLLNIIHQRTFWIEQLSTPWRRNLNECGGLYLPLFGSHDIDAILWQAADVPKRVWGSIRATSAVSQGDSDGLIGLELTGGALSSLAFSTRYKKTHRNPLQRRNRPDPNLLIPPDRELNRLSFPSPTEDLSLFLLYKIKFTLPKQHLNTEVFLGFSQSGL